MERQPLSLRSLRDQTRRRVRRAGLVAFAMAAALASSAFNRAEAYVQTKTSMGAPYYWKESCAAITIYLNGFDKSQRSHMTQNEIVKAVTAAAHTWSTDAVTCGSGDATVSPYFEIVPSLAPASAALPPIAWDAKNSIIFRTDTWGTGAMYYADAGLAVTTVTARLDGHIVDADMEINGRDFTWMNLDPGVSAAASNGQDADVYDLQNALTHEFGHFIGLAHTCVDYSTASPQELLDLPTDDAGQTVPDCNALPADFKPSVMFPSTDTLDVNNRTLTVEDVRAVCEIYAPSDTPQVCALDSATPSCSLASVAPQHVVGRETRRRVAAAAGALLVLTVRRRRRRGPRRRD
jgi:hypothetical protein